MFPVATKVPGACAVARGANRRKRITNSRNVEERRDTRTVCVRQPVVCGEERLKILFGCKLMKRRRNVKAVGKTDSYGTERLRFGSFELSGSTGELLNDGLPVKLQPQPFRVLRLLVSRPGELITREEIQETLWAGGTTVEFDQGLNYCIRQIRAAINDDAREPRFIETLPKRGYRFIAAVDSAPSNKIAPQVASPRPRQSRRWLWAAAAAILLIAVAGMALMRERETPLALRPPKDTYTYNLYLEAVHLGDLWEVPSVNKSIEDFREVLRRAPDFAPAYVGLSNVLTQSSRADELLTESESLARRALGLDNKFAGAHAALAHSYYRQWRWEEADAEFRKALELDPGDAVTHQLYGLFLVSVGRDTEEAVDHGVRAIQLEPTSGLKNHTLANIYLQTRQYDLTVKQELKTLAIFPRFPNAYERLAYAYSMKGMTRESEEALDKAKSYGEHQATWRIRWLMRAGRSEEARAMLERKPTPRNDLVFAGVIASLGDLSRAFEYLNAAVDHHAGSLIWIKTHPELDLMRSDPRFRQVLARMNLK